MAATQAATFGTLLKRLRVAAGFTQEELAERAGLSPHGISDLERGARNAPRRDTLLQLAEALSLGPEERARLEAAARAGRTTGGPAPTPAPPPVEEPAAPAGPAAPLVGRRRELALLRRQLAGDAPPALLFAGEPGMGKTRLLREAAEQGRARGWAVLAGAPYRRRGQEPYAPLLEVMERALAGRTPAERQADLKDCAWLVRLLPELAGECEPPPEGRLPAEQERRLIFAAVRRFLGGLGGRVGTLLVLDDLQWAGADALDLLVSLLRAGGQPPLRLVGAYRETEVGARGAVGEWLAELARDGLATQARLKPLGDDEAAELLRAVLQAAPSLSGAANAIPSFALRAVERAEGVPFYVVSFAHALQVGSSEASMLGGVPWDVAQSVRLRLGALPEAAQELLKVAAVAERRVSRRLLEVVMARADGGDGELLAAIEAACEARLLVEAGDDAYRFTYDLVRKVIRADLGAARRAALHRRIAQALEAGEGEAPVEALAYHYARASEPERAAAYLERAAERARRMQAHATAAGYERELVERLEGLGRHAAAAQARERLGLALTQTADYEEALAVLGRAAQTYRDAGDLEGVGRVAGRVGLVEAQRGATRPDPEPPLPGEVAP